MPNATTLREATLVAAMKGTMETAFRVSADNVMTISVPITRSAYQQELKSANAEKVFTSMMILTVSTLTSVKRLRAMTELNVPTRREATFVLKRQL